MEYADILKVIGSRDIVVWGTGVDAARNMPVFLQNGYSVHHFVAQNAPKGTTFFEKPVLDGAELDPCRHFVFISTSKYFREIKNALEEKHFLVGEDYMNIQLMEIGTERVIPIEEWVREYDYVFSLGTSCKTAKNMEFHELRRCSGPFDWYISGSMETLLHGFETQFNNFFVPGQMELWKEQEQTSPHAHYLDNATGYLSLHEVPKDRPAQKKGLKIYSKHSGSAWNGSWLCLGVTTRCYWCGQAVLM